MSLLRSTALEPAPGSLAGLPLSRRLAALLPVYGLVVLAVLLALLFSVLLPDTFPTWLNLRSMLSDKAVVAMLALAATVPMMTGKIDLTVGYGVVLWHILTISLQIAGVPWPVAVLVVLLLGILFGLLNGLLVEVAQIDSFIATLGTGSVIYAFALWWTGGQQVIGRLAPSFFAIDTARIAGVPIPAFYVLVLAVILWLISAYTPLGRYLYAIGANPRAAELNGIATRRQLGRAFFQAEFIETQFVAEMAILLFQRGLVKAMRVENGNDHAKANRVLNGSMGFYLDRNHVMP